MKLGILAGYSGEKISLPMDEILEAERLGYDSVWTAEAYGSDAVTPAAWILALTSTIKVGTAIMQIPARTPAATAMTAMTLNELSGGRFILGLGPSGPQVVEGWHGASYGRPLTRMREYISIIRQVFAREAPVQFEGYHYQLPFKGEGATGLGKPLKSILHGDPSARIYTGAITPAGVELAAELADGFFAVWMNPERFDVFADGLQSGFGKAGNGKGLADFDVAPFVRVEMGDDVHACRMKVKQELALYVGGMGARNKNFYNDYTKKLGYEAAAVTVQERYLSGDKQGAAEAIPDEYVDDVYLVGPPEHIKEQLQRWKAAADKGHVGTLCIGGASIDALRLIAEECL